MKSHSSKGRLSVRKDEILVLTRFCPTFYNGRAFVSYAFIRHGSTGQSIHQIIISAKERIVLGLKQILGFQPYLITPRWERGEK